MKKKTAEEFKAAIERGDVRVVFDAPGIPRAESVRREYISVRDVDELRAAPGQLCVDT